MYAFGAEYKMSKTCGAEVIESDTEVRILHLHVGVLYTFLTVSVASV